MSHELRQAIVFDIETKADASFVERPEFVAALQARYEPPGNLKDPVKIGAHHTEWLAKQPDHFPLSPLTGRVVAIAWADLWDGSVTCSAFDDYPGNAEFETLRSFSEALDDAGPAVLTGYRVRDFDVPFVTVRAALHGVALPDWWPHAKDYRGIADIYDVVQSGKLAEWLDCFGLPPKTADGSEVEGMTIDQVREYCRNDVEVERQLAQRFAHYMPPLRATIAAHTERRNAGLPLGR